MLDNGIKFDERCVNKELDTTTFYFIAPKEMLKTFITAEDYPEAISMEISVELPTNHMESNDASVCVSPTRENEWGMEDYDWYDVDLPYDEIDELISLAEKKTNNAA
ncbi:MAG: hypothetical protein PUF72_05430 [Clostridiales bacterium]|nr:hypothetical protein [Clostridiales bacterium]